MGNLEVVHDWATRRQSRKRPLVVEFLSDNDGYTPWN